jgi:hypothetical protein
MLEIFPELKETANILFMVPSKKSLRRFPSTISPVPLERDMWSHNFYSERVRQDVHEVAAAFFRRRKFGQTTKHLESQSKCKTHLESRTKCLNTRHFESVARSRGGRDAIVKNVFWRQTPQHHTTRSRITSNSITAKHSSPLSREAIPDDESLMDLQRLSRPLVEQQYWVRQ